MILEPGTYVRIVKRPYRGSFGVLNYDYHIGDVCFVAENNDEYDLYPGITIIDYNMERAVVRVSENQIKVMSDSELVMWRLGG